MSRDPRQGNTGAESKAAVAAALYQKAAQALEMGRLAEAEHACRQILADFPGNASVLHLLGLVAFRAGHLTDAGALIERSLAAEPNAVEPHNSLGGVFIELGEPENALREFDLALKLRLAYPDAHANRARALLILGRTQDAVDSARKAVALRPDFFDAWTHLGNGLLTQKRFGDAAEAFAQAVALRPDHAGAHINLGKAVAEQGDEVLAELEFRRAVALTPQDFEACLGLAYALNKTGRYGEARAAFENALRLAPANLDALMGLADTQLQLGTHEAAFATYAFAVGLSPDDPRIHTNLGSAYMVTGHRDAAIDALTTALRRDPSQIGALAALIQTQDPNPDDPLIARAETLLDRGEVRDADDETSLRFILGNIWLKGNDSDRAFAHLDKANGLKRARVRFDIDYAERYFESIAAQFGPALFDHLKGAGVPSDLPIFIVGMPRSGTTLVEQILASHPDVWGAGELLTISRLVRELPAPRYPEIMKTADAVLLSAFGKAYLAEVTPLAQGRARLVDKMPGNFDAAGLIAVALSGARIIHCQRDAVDTCLSCYALQFSGNQSFTYDQTELGRYWRAYDRLMDHWRTVLPPDRFIEVRYEDVVADLETQARRLIGFSGLPWNDACLSFYKTERQVWTASQIQVRKPIYRQSVRRWTRHARNLRPLLKALGVDEPV